MKTRSRLLFQFQPVHEEEDAPGVAGAQEEFDDGGCGESLASACGHLEQEPVRAVPHGLLQRVDGVQLVRPQETEAVRVYVAGALSLVLPRGVGGVVRTLSQDDVVVPHRFVNEPLGVGSHLSSGLCRVRCGKRGDDVRVALFEVPPVVEVAVRKDDEPAVLRAGVLPRLLLADERALVL